jgi:hypothetical protein
MVTNKLLDKVFLPLQMRISIDIFNEDLERLLMEENTKKLFRVYTLTNKDQKYNDYYGYYLYLTLCSEIERIY